MFKTPRQAGLIALKNTDHYLLVVVSHRWLTWSLVQCLEGNLAQLSLHAQGLAIAFVIPDSDVLYWLEEFPQHLSPNAIKTYLYQTKAELIHSPKHYLSLEKLPSPLPHSNQWRCWLLTEENSHSILQAPLTAGLSIQAIEPISALEARPLLRYQDLQQYLVKSAYPQATLNAFKVACRHNWAKV